MEPGDWSSESGDRNWIRSHRQKWNGSIPLGHHTPRFAAEVSSAMKFLAAEVQLRTAET